MTDTDTIAVSRRDLETLVRAADALGLEDHDYGISGETLEEAGLAAVRDATDEDRDMRCDPDLDSVVELKTDVCEVVNRLAPLVGYQPSISFEPAEAAEAAE